MQDLQDLVQDLASLARKILARLVFFLQDDFYSEATRGCVGELEDTKRDLLGHSLELRGTEQLIKNMYLDYQSLIVVTLVSTFGLLLVALVKENPLL